MSGEILLRVRAGAGPRPLAEYRADRGYDGLYEARGMTPAEVTEGVRAARLRGRGGAGFPAGDKWAFVPAGVERPVYLVANADEGEPGTFKDRALLARDPHMLIEGMAITAHAIGARLGFIYLRGEYAELFAVLEAAIAEARRAGILADGFFEVCLFSGAGSYVCGEETALIESLEGRRGQPRLRPPFPAVEGLYGCPTIVHNVETLCCLPFILREGPVAFCDIGTPASPGPKLFSVSGAVTRPGVYERPMGITLADLIAAAGGVPDGRRLVAVFPGGLSSAVLTAGELDVGMDFESLAAVGSSLGSGGVIVLDDRVSIREVLARGVAFYAYESCGQCAPCREGTVMMARLVERGGKDDLGQLRELCDALSGANICPLGDSAAIFAASLLDKLGERIALA